MGGAVQFKELAGSPTETYDSNGMRAQRRIMCKWTDRKALIEQVLGDGYSFGGVGQIHYPDEKSVVVVSAACKPFASDVTPQELRSLEDDLQAYDTYVIVTLNYKTVDPVTLPDVENIDGETGTFLSYRTHGGVEYELIHGRGEKWEADSPGGTPEKIVENVWFGYRISVAEHVITWHRVLQPPLTTIRSLRGRVNAAEWLGIPTHCLLFDTYSLEREYILPWDFQRSRAAWQLSYVFRERIVPLPGGGIGGWQHRYRTEPAEKAGWTSVEDVNGNPLYPTTDAFGTLFTYGGQSP